MLALKTLSAIGSGQAGKTLIFDEVDAGIGGRVASVVGEKLAGLGRRFQVLCITHLPQIAASGRTHFLIEKRLEGRRTATRVARLEGEDRIREIARMMGGTAAGEQAMAGARELLAGAEAKGKQQAKAKGEGRSQAKATS
jgi:DNA repair protein RecN (Recombination protein N)